MVQNEGSHRRYSALGTFLREAQGAHAALTAAAEEAHSDQG